MREPFTKLTGVARNDDQTRLYKAKVISKVGYNLGGDITHSPKPVKLVVNLGFACGMTVKSTVFGATFIWSAIQTDDDVEFTGKLTLDSYGLSIKSPSFATATGKVETVYTGIPGKIAGSVIEPFAKQQLANRESLIQTAQLIRSNPVVVGALRSCGYSSGVDFLKALHAPADVAAGNTAIRAARYACIRDIQYQGNANQLSASLGQDIKPELVDLVLSQSETLSQGQRHALNVIRREFARNKSARVLLNGDVGSGKTLVFLLAAAAVATRGRNVVIIVPSELVARQIHQQAMLRFAHLSPLLFISADKEQPALKNKILIGTTALLGIEVLDVGLVVVDEQHKFSVEQRNHFVGTDTHVIEASATPIPRSLALALFNGWVEAKIAGSPYEKSITSHILTAGTAFHAKQSILQGLSKGMKTMMVYPSVGGGEKSAIQAFKRLDERHPGKIALAHGKMKSSEKESALQSLKDGERSILVATTVVEVGIDIPDVTTFVVHEAQTFGVSQLHQMRGRLVRHGGVGSFYMMVRDNASKDTLKRLEAVKNNFNGFDLAERDLELRGFGDVLGDTQSGGTKTFFKLPRLEAIDFLDVKKP